MAKKTPEQLAIPVAFGRGGRPYKATDIGKEMADIIGDELVDAHFQPVKANLETDRAQSHFALVSGASTPFARAENNALHNRTIDDLVDVLSGAPVFSIYARSKRAESVSDFKLFSSHESSDYVWVQEPLTRILTQASFVQPDISGVDRSRRYPGAKNRSVIIEVIHTHPPAQATWDSLVELSRWHHIVLLYFVAGTSTTNKQNKFWGGAKAANIKVRFYLKAGQLYDGALAVRGSGRNLTIGERDVLCFTPGMADASSNVD